MSSWAAVGVKCVCVDATWEVGGTCPITERQTYTIAWIGRNLGAWGKHAGSDLVVRLEGVANPYSPDSAFALSRFQPLITRTQEQDVEMILSLLTDAPAEVDA